MRVLALDHGTVADRLRALGPERHPGDAAADDRAAGAARRSPSWSPSTGSSGSSSACRCTSAARRAARPALARSFCAELEAMLLDPGRDLRRAPDHADGRREPARRRHRRAATRSPPPTCSRPTWPASRRRARSDAEDELTTGCTERPVRRPRRPGGARARAAAPRTRGEAAPRRRRARRRRGRRPQAPPPAARRATAASLRRASPAPPDEASAERGASSARAGRSGTRSRRAGAGRRPELPAPSEEPNRGCRRRLRARAVAAATAARPRRRGATGVLAAMRPPPVPARRRDRRPSFVLWFLFALFQPFHGDGSGEVAGDDPERRQRQRSRRPARREGRDRQLDPVPGPGHARRQALRALPGPLHPRRRHVLRRRDRRALHSRRSRRSPRSRSPRATAARRRRSWSRKSGSRADYTEGDASARSTSNPAEYGGKGAKDLEGFLFPDTFELKPDAPAADLVQLQLQDFKRRIKGVDMSYAKSKNLTVFDVVTIASMVEARRGSTRQRTLVAAVIYNRLHEGMPLGIDATIRFATGNYDRAADRIGTGDRLALQHPHQRRPAAGADQQPRPRLDRSRRPPGEDRLPLLRDQAGRLRRARLRQDRSRIRSRRRHATTKPAKRRRQRAGQPAGNRRCRGSRSSATRSRTRARRRCRTRRWRRSGWRRSGATRRSTSPRRASSARVRALPGEGFAGANVTVPHKEAALALADDASETAREIGAANTLSLRRRRDPAPTTPTPTACSRRCPASPAGGRALVLGAGGAARAVVWALLREGAAVEVWNRTALRARNLCEELGGTAVERARRRPPTT